MEIYEIEQNFAQPLQIVLRQNTGYGYVETVGSSEKKQTIIVKRPKRVRAPKPLVAAERVDGTAWGNNFDDVQTERLAPVDISRSFNSQVSDIFKNFYLSPRPPYTTLQIPVHGIGDWCHPDRKVTVDESVLRQHADGGVLTVDIAGGIPFRFPQQGRNIVYTSLWDNYPDVVEIPLSGSASHAYLLMAGSTNHMQSRIDNGVVTVRYTDGSADTLRLCNPHNWCPIEQDYYEDGLAFHAAQPRSYRLDFASLRVSRQLMPMGDRYGYEQRYFEKGAGIVLDMPLNRSKQLQSLTLRTLSNDIVVGFGCKFKDLNLFGAKRIQSGQKKSKNKKGSADEDTNNSSNSRTAANRRNTVSHDLNLRCDFSYRMQNALNRNIQTMVTTATNGSTAYKVSLAADYTFSRLLTLSGYMDWQRNEPLVSASSYPTTTADFGVSMKFSLTR